jgi:FAD/FMN-containing dehydrogenase/Fe-S oxidoreductase
MNAPLASHILNAKTSPSLERSRIAARLRRVLKGEVLFDAASRGRYSTDASIYQIEPIGVVVPQDEADVSAALDLAKEMSLPVLPRGGGTSQCGQTVGEALVIDQSKFLNKIIQFDAEQQTVEVQPGLVLDHLNAYLKPHGLWYPVDVSTSAQATLGGMAGNNSCGSRSLAYGNMVHNVLGIDAVLADGTQEFFGPFGASATRAMASTRTASLVSRLFEIGEREKVEIERVWPKVLRRVGGYNLDVFHPMSERPYTADNSVNLSHLLVGSEGTLAMFRRLHLKLAPLPTKKLLGVVNFESFYRAMDSAQHIVKLGPVAVELVDRTMIDLARKNPAFKKTMETALVNPLAQTPEAILLVEFAGDDLSILQQKIKALSELMGDLGLPGTVVEMLDSSRQKELWEVRKAGLNIMMSLRGDGKPVSFIEDCAVPLEHLAEYTQALTDVFGKHGTRGTWYAHASVGTLHVRPILDMRQSGIAGGAAKMRAIAEEASELVRKYKGAYSGEHGDGLARSEWVSWQFGERLNRAFEEVKDLFDPQGLMNPGKIVRPPRMDEASLFRYKPGYQARAINTGLDWSAWNVQADPVTEVVGELGSGGDPAEGFAKALEMCNNNGHCRKFDAGTMCPSYRVTRDEQHLTRGRANTLRLALSGQLQKERPDGAQAPGPQSAVDLNSTEVMQALDLCVSCKGCKRDCPTGVDMARMKIEVLHQQRLGGRRLSFGQWLVVHLPRYAPLASKFAFLMNLRDRLPGAAKLSEALLGFSARRSLPTWPGRVFTKLSGAKLSQNAKEDAPEVVLWADTFNNYFESENLQAAKEVLEAAGYRVHLAQPTFKDVEARPLCCGRTYFSQGMLIDAKYEAERTLRGLQKWISKGLPVIGLEPSCLLTMRDEFLSLKLAPSMRELALKLAGQAYLLEEFIAKELDAGRFLLKLKPASERSAWLHGHCHQKAFDAVRPIEQVLGLIPGLKVTTIESSCCGMAGSFGYEASHIDVSMAMAELSLLPAVRKAGAEDLIVADGTSCRHQIKDGAKRSAIHVARVLQQYLV